MDLSIKRSSSTSTARSSATTTGRRSRRPSSGRGRAAPARCASPSTRPARDDLGTVIEGPWALLRLFDKVNFEPVANSQVTFRATFDIDGRKAVFEVTASSVRNPFRLRELHDFQCPMGL